MEELRHALNAPVLCNRKGCEQLADYLGVDDHGQGSALRTPTIKTHASQLPTRKPSPDLPFRADLPLELWAVPSAEIRRLRDFNASRNAGFAAAVSDLALIILEATDESPVHDGMSPSEPATVHGRAPSDSGG
jgi:hypothetical protein